MKKIGLISLILVLALGALGVAYAAWTDTIIISGTVTTGELAIEFTAPAYTNDPSNQPDENMFFDLHGTWEQMDKDVGVTTVTILDPGPGYGRTLEVILDNAYPYYFVAVDFKIHGLSSHPPVKVWKVEFWVDNDLKGTFYETAAPTQFIELNLDGVGGNDLEIAFDTRVLGAQLELSWELDTSMEILVLQPAPQGEELKFQIKIWAIQWNDYVPGPLPPE